MIVGLVILDDQALPNKKLQGLMPPKKLLHLLLIALLLFLILGEMGLRDLIVRALLYLLAFHLLRVLFTGLLAILEDSALELHMLSCLSFFCHNCYVLISFIDILRLGLSILLHCHFRLVLLPLPHDELKGRHSLADQHHMEANQREQYKRKRQSSSKHNPSNHHRGYKILPILLLMYQAHSHTKEEHIQKRRNDHTNKPSIILLSDAVIHPRTVMVEPINTSIT